MVQSSKESDQVTLIVATKNSGKLREIREICRQLGVEVRSLADYPAIPDIAETGDTFLANALIKARTVQKITGQLVMADDSGLEVDALNGAPGIYSSRFAGRSGDDAANNAKLLNELKGVPWEKRTARFRCIIALVDADGKEITCEGTCEGLIALVPKGCEGFGYDPLFYVPRYDKTFAELDQAIKNQISHRAKALAKARRQLMQLLKM